MVTFKICT